MPDELYDAVKQYFEENEQQLKLRHGVRSMTAFVSYCIREYMKEKDII